MTAYERWDKVGIKENRYKKCLLLRDGAGLTWGRKGRGRYVWHFRYIPMEGTGLAFLALMTMKPDPLKQINFAFIILFFPQMLSTFELAKISKDRVLNICYVSTLPVFCYLLLTQIESINPSTDVFSSRYFFIHLFLWSIHLHWVPL